jgi:hypothetical protein
LRLDKAENQDIRGELKPACGIVDAGFDKFRWPPNKTDEGWEL